MEREGRLVVVKGCWWKGGDDGERGGLRMVEGGMMMVHGG